MARTPRVVEDRREQIIDAAMRVFAQKGFTRATNKDIAREAGITPGLIYHYFESKEALFKAIIEMRSPLKLVSELPAQTLALAPEIFLPFVLRQMLGIVEDEKFVQVIRAFLPEVVHNPQMAPLALSVLQRAIAFLSGYLASQVESGALQKVNVDLVAQTLLGSMIGFVFRRQIMGDPTALQYTQEQIADVIVNTVLQGVLPR